MHIVFCLRFTFCVTNVYCHVPPTRTQRIYILLVRDYFVFVFAAEHTADQGSLRSEKKTQKNAFAFPLSLSAHNCRAKAPPTVMGDKECNRSQASVISCALNGCFLHRGGSHSWAFVISAGRDLFSSLWRVRLQHSSPIRNLSTLRLRY